MVTTQNGQPSAVLHTRGILLGLPGFGKYMLPRILVGLLRANSGQALFRGDPQCGPNPSLSVAFRLFALFPWLTVLQNVELGLQAQDLLKTLRLKRSLATIDTIGLNSFMQALACTDLLRRIVTDLQQDAGHTAQEEPYLAQLAQYFDEDEARAQLEAIIDWGHYAELFSYVEDRGVFRQETEEAEEA